MGGQARVDDHALRWFVRLRSGDATVVDLWLAQSWASVDASHRSELNKVVRLWEELDEVKSLLIEELDRDVGDRDRGFSRSVERPGKRRLPFVLSAVLGMAMTLFVPGEVRGK